MNVLSGQKQVIRGEKVLLVLSSKLHLVFPGLGICRLMKVRSSLFGSN
jgi:hypothetical protein